MRVSAVLAIATLWLSAALAGAACGTEPAPPAPAKPTMANREDLDRVAAAKLRLRDPQQGVRDAAAEFIRQSLARDPAASGDPGEAFWQRALAAVPRGATPAEVEKALGAATEAEMPGGKARPKHYRLDDFWTVLAYFDSPGGLRSFAPPSRQARRVSVAAPENYSGRWVTYYVNGVVDREIDCRAGRHERIATRHDNGQLQSEQRFVDGKADGRAVGYYPDGKKMSEVEYAGGEMAGRWVNWYPNGNKQAESTYLAGKLDGVSTGWREDGSKAHEIHYRRGEETGQAAWDERGSLLYARGSAAGAQNAAPGAPR